MIARFPLRPRECRVVLFSCSPLSWGGKIKHMIQNPLDKHQHYPPTGHLQKTSEKLILWPHSVMQLWRPLDRLIQSSWLERSPLKVAVGNKEQPGFWETTGMTRPQKCEWRWKTTAQLLGNWNLAQLRPILAVSGFWETTASEPDHKNVNADDKQQPSF